MPTICVLSDSHLGYRHRMKLQRLKDYRKAFLEAVSEINKQKPDLVIHLGDLFHHKKPDPISMKTAYNALKKLADETPVVLCIGNHDIEGHLGSSYSPLFTILHENIHVLTHENPHVEIEIKNQKIGLHGFQYMRDRKQVEEQLEEITKNVGGNDAEILCIHQAIEGYLEPHEVSLKCLRSLAPKYDLILSGHVHKHQEIKEISDVTPAYYAGSTERISFNESDNRNGFLTFKNNRFREPEFVEVESAPMKKIREDLGEKSTEEVNSHIENLLTDNEGSVKCLQVNLSVELEGEYFNLRQDWSTQFHEYTILDVNVIPDKLLELQGDFEKKPVNENLIREYFTKTGMEGRKQLKEVCVRLYQEYGKQ
ncbi:MAG: DNA repair exonuclease [Candidatus Altiarchaeota archaeon]|nr:DNA repair exonuclease [Candidatus Altiarchaeota archaeon]